MQPEYSDIIEEDDVLVRVDVFEDREPNIHIQIGMFSIAATPKQFWTLKDLILDAQESVQEGEGVDNG